LNQSGVHIKNCSWWLLFCLVLLCISGVPKFFLGRRVDCVCVNARVLGNTQLKRSSNTFFGDIFSVIKLLKKIQKSLLDKNKKTKKQKGILTLLVEIWQKESHFNFKKYNMTNQSNSNINNHEVNAC
uniref:Uncharacterized protein n=1 Tax=Oryzias latipes TaxID=8090 RepID=A0A3P9M689_ORYLA